MAYPRLGVSQSGRPPLPVPPGQEHQRGASGGSSYNEFQNLSFEQVAAYPQPMLRQSVRGSTPVLPPLPPEYLAEQRLSQSRGPSIVSPIPQHLPSFVPAGNLESQASELGAVPPYQPSHIRSSSLQSQPPPFDSNPLAFSQNSGQHSNNVNFNSAPLRHQDMPSTISHSNSLPVGAMSHLSIDQGRPRSQVSQLSDNRRASNTSANQQRSSHLRQSTSGDSNGAPTMTKSSLLPPAAPARPVSTGPVLQTHKRETSLPNSRHSRSSTEIGASKLAKPLPTEDDLAQLRERSQTSADPGRKVKFAKEIFKYLERNQSGTTIADPRMISWVDEAVKIVLNFSSSMPPVPEAMYLKADLAMSGTFPTMIPKNPKSAFRDLESAANAEYAPAWYRIGREYETFSDLARAREAYERGSALGDVTSTYRLGMAHLLGQLTLQADVGRGLEFLHTSALIAEQVGDTDTAAPLYVWAMILAGEFEAPNIPPESLPRHPTDAGRFMQKAAYLCHVTAQFKMGWAYEHAQLGCSFDPFMSVQYYTLASQQGDSESDMSLSKWFLCGAEGCFSANEDLAYSFAEKAANKGLPSAEFAMGYYTELGIGTSKNPQAGKQWYDKAAAHGNEDARNRLRLLQAGNSMSRTEHNAHAAELVRKRTQARIRSDAENRTAAPQMSATPSQDLDRKQTLKRAQQVAQSAALGPPAEVKRFTLSDTGSTNSAGPPRKVNQPVVVAAPSKGPATFAEMGIPTSKLKDGGDCIIS